MANLKEIRNEDGKLIQQKTDDFSISLYGGS